MPLNIFKAPNQWMETYCYRSYVYIPDSPQVDGTLVELKHIIYTTFYTISFPRYKSNMVVAVQTKMKQNLAVKSSKPRKERGRQSKKTTASQKMESSPHREVQPNSAARVKRFHSKSRKGCLTCRYVNPVCVVNHILTLLQATSSQV